MCATTWHGKALARSATGGSRLACAALLVGMVSSQSIAARVAGTSGKACKDEKAYLGAMAEASQARPRFRVLTAELPPYTSVEGGKIGGQSTSLVKQILDPVVGEEGYSVLVVPWARGYAMARSERDTLLYSVFRIPQRENHFQWIARLGSEVPSRLYKLRSRTDVRVRSFEDLRASRLTIATQRGGMDATWLEANGFGSRLILSPSFQGGFDLLSKSRADLVSINDTSLAAEAASDARLKDHDLEPVILLFSSAPYLAASPSTDREQVERLRANYDRLIKEGLDVSR